MLFLMASPLAYTAAPQGLAPCKPGREKRLTAKVASQTTNYRVLSRFLILLNCTVTLVRQFRSYYHELRRALARFT